MGTVGNAENAENVGNEGKGTREPLETRMRETLEIARDAGTRTRAENGRNFRN